VVYALFHYAVGTLWIRNRLQGTVRSLMYHRFRGREPFKAKCALLRKYSADHAYGSVGVAARGTGLHDADRRMVSGFECAGSHKTRSIADNRQG
jgi:hypothetical protein